MDKYEVLKKYYGYHSFRAGQEVLIEGILCGRDAFGIMPTGAGKSICYQVPALMMSGITIVVSPLISLMKDQVRALNEAGVHAAYINSSLTENQIVKALANAKNGRYKIVYAAPERLLTPRFLDFAMNVPISMITVDEAHCISQWGQDFRPSYRSILDLVERLPKRPVVSAFTATATDVVQSDIMNILKLRNPVHIVTGYDRKNLYFEVVQSNKKDWLMVDYIKKHEEESGIIYCSTRKNVEKVYSILVSQGISATKYHAGLDGEVRKKNQDDFIYDEKKIVVATNAFGMGIDKSNVRYVLHYNMPQSMENYYQEAGRAGRDGENARCILLFAAKDVIINKFLLDKKVFEGTDADDIDLIKQRDVHRLRVMEGYCRTTSCLRNYILEYFGERTSAPCDNCGNCHREYSEADMTDDAKWVINCVAETKGRYGQNIVIGTLLGANRARLKEVGATAYKSYGVLAHRKETDLRLLINQMLAEAYIVQTDGEYSVLRMGDISGLRSKDTRIIVRTFVEKEKTVSDTGKKKRSTDTLTGAGFKLFEKLRQLRLVIAKEEAMPPYIIFSDKTLIDMCAKVPRDRQEMLTVSGVAETKFKKYGERFLAAVTEYVSENPDAVISIQVENE